MRVRTTNTQSGTHPLKCTHEAHAEGGHTYHACSCTEWGEGSSLTIIRVQQRQRAPSLPIHSSLRVKEKERLNQNKRKASKKR